MLRPFSSYRNLYLEVTDSIHGHGGPGWEFGKCLWSPSKNAAGADRYSIMREPQSDDLVVHVDREREGSTWHRRFVGTSVVAQPVQTVHQSPPEPGPWADTAPYYRIMLRNFQRFPAPLNLDRFINDYENEIRRDFIGNSPSFYPIPRYPDTVRLVAGIYLARFTPTLYELLREALGLTAAQQEAQPHVPAAEELQDYAEHRRRLRERYFFARNPRLAASAKERDAYICQACGFNFRAAYGALGEGFAEAHHLNPLAERLEREWATALRTHIDDVVTLGANCHRVIHRNRPPISVADLQTVVASQRQP